MRGGEWTDFREADYGKAENHETDEKDEEGQQTCD